MAIQRDDRDERERRLHILIERFRADDRRALVKQGVELWTRTERQVRDQATRQAPTMH